MRRYPLLLGTLVLAAACASTVSAALYKWTDAQGRVVYSDQPPATSVKTEQLRAPPPAANPDAAKELAQREADFRKRHADEAKSAEKAQKERADTAKLAEACSQARGQLRQLDQTQVAVVRFNDKGEREILGEDARNRERAKVNAFIRDSKCPA
jgi:Skp family chaperone for outer membrane proteins